MEAENPAAPGSRPDEERERVVMQPTIMEISDEEFEQIISKHINWASEWDGILPADVFFGAWADLRQEHKPVELQARLVEGRLEIQAPPKSRVRATRDHVFLEDGRELVIRFEPAAQAG
jgi:hypothetical protein